MKNLEDHIMRKKDFLILYLKNSIRLNNNSPKKEQELEIRESLKLKVIQEE